MTLKRQTFNNGTDGTAVTLANSATSGDAFGTLGLAGTGTITYETASASRGLAGCRCVAGDTSGNATQLVLSALSPTGLAAQLYFRVNSFPSATQQFFRLQSGSTSLIRANVTTTGTIQLQNGGGIGAKTTAAITLGAWYRFDAQIITGTTTSDGTFAFQITRDSTGVLFDSYSTVAGNSGVLGPDRITFGKIGATGTGDYSFDEIAIQDSFTAVTPVPGGPVTATAAVAITTTGTTESSAAVAPVVAITAAGGLVSSGFTETASVAPAVTLTATGVVSKLPVANTMEGGTNGTTITTGNTSTGGTTLDDVATVALGTLVFDNAVTPAGHGTYALKAATAGTAGNSFAGWGNTATGTTAGAFSGRFYFSTGTLATFTSSRIFTCNAANGVPCFSLIYTRATNVITVIDTAGSTIGTLSAVSQNTWYRIEFQCTPSTTVGRVQVQVYSPIESATVVTSVDTGATRNLGGTGLFGNVRFGISGGTVASAGPYYYDDMRVVAGSTAVGASVTGVSSTASASAAAALTATGVLGLVSTASVSPTSGAISFVDQATNVATTGTTLGAVMPTVQDGDVAFLTYAGARNVLTIPSGWTDDSASVGVSHGQYHKVLTAAESGTTSLITMASAFTSTNRGIVGLVVYRGASLVDVTAYNSGTSATGHTLPTKAIANANSVLVTSVGFSGASDTTFVLSGTGVTTRSSTQARNSIAVGEQTYASAGTSDAITATSGIASIKYGWQMQLVAAPSGAPITVAVTATGAMALSTSATTTATATVNATGSIGLNSTASEAVSVAVTATGVVGKSETAAVAAGVTVTASAAALTAATANVAATVAQTATGLLGFGRTATVAPSVTITATGRIDDTASVAVLAQVTAVGSMAAGRPATSPVTVTVTAEGVVAATSTAARGVAVGITAAGVVASTTDGQRDVSVSVTAAGLVGTSGPAVSVIFVTITAVGTVATRATAQVAVAVVMTTTGERLFMGGARDVTLCGSLRPGLSGRVRDGTLEGTLTGALSGHLVDSTC